VVKAKSLPKIRVDRSSCRCSTQESSCLASNIRLGWKGFVQEGRNIKCFIRLTPDFHGNFELELLMNLNKTFIFK
jgi:hypothetical protein